MRFYPLFFLLFFLCHLAIWSVLTILWWLLSIWRIQIETAIFSLGSWCCSIAVDRAKGGMEREDRKEWKAVSMRLSSLEEERGSPWRENRGG